MKNRFFFLMMMLATVLVSFGQNADIYDTQYFSCRDYHTKNGTTIYLYEKGNAERPQSVDEHASISNWDGFWKNLSQITEKVFQDVPEEDLKHLSRISFTFYYDIEGNIDYYEIHFGKNLLKDYPNLENQLYQVVSKLKEHGVREYGIHISEKNKLEMQNGVCTSNSSILGKVDILGT